MTKSFFTETLLAAALLLAAPLPAVAQMQGQAQHHPQSESGAPAQPVQPAPGPMGQGMTGQGLTGPGMTTPGTGNQGMMGQGMMGQGMMGQDMMGPGMTGQGMMGMMPDGGNMPMMGGDAATGMGMTHCPMMAQMMRMHPEMMSMMHGRMGGGHMAGSRMGMGHMGMGHMGMGHMGRHQGDRHRGAGSGMMMGPQAGNMAAGVVEPIEHLSVDDVRHFFEHRLAQIGNERLKVGKVEPDGEDSILAEIVTLDDSLVERLAVDRHSGAISRKP